VFDHKPQPQPPAAANPIAAYTNNVSNSAFIFKLIQFHPLVLIIYNFHSVRTYAVKLKNIILAKLELSF
jgi:hypothetical protein